MQFDNSSIYQSRIFKTTTLCPTYRTMLRIFTLAAAVVSLFLLAGCNTVSISTNQALGVPTYPPNLNPAAIPILTKPPTRSHLRLGDIKAEPSSDGVSAAQITQSLQKAAAKLGADAVVIVYDRNEILGAMVSGPWWGRSVQTYTGRVIVGVAIKYQ